MKIYFVRHGETDWNVQKKIQGKTDIPLNQRGQEQARRLADKLLTENLKAVSVYTSPQKRAFQTAQELAVAMKLDLKVLSGLAEMNLGEWEGLNWRIIFEKYGEQYLDWNSHRRYTRTPGGESYNDVLGRSIEALKEILENEMGNVIVVTHSAVLMALRCYHAHLPFTEENMVRKFKSDNAEVILLDASELRKMIQEYENE